AMEMASLDDVDALELSEPEFEQAPISAARSLESETAPVTVEPVAVAQEPPPITSPPQPVAEPPREASAELSLGSTIIASGIFRKPNISANDPLAPIRRMSQTEKIAFFSQRPPSALSSVTAITYDQSNPA